MREVVEIVNGQKNNMKKLNKNFDFLMKRQKQREVKIS